MSHIQICHVPHTHVCTPKSPSRKQKCKHKCKQKYKGAMPPIYSYYPWFPSTPTSPKFEICARTNASCPIYEWVVSHIWMRHVPYMNGWCPMYTQTRNKKVHHAKRKCEGVMPHIHYHCPCFQSTPTSPILEIRTLGHCTHSLRPVRLSRFFLLLDFCALFLSVWSRACRHSKRLAFRASDDKACAYSRLHTPTCPEKNVNGALLWEYMALLYTLYMDVRTPGYTPPHALKRMWMGLFCENTWLFCTPYRWVCVPGYTPPHALKRVQMGLFCQNIGLFCAPYIWMSSL